MFSARHSRDVKKLTSPQIAFVNRKGLLADWQSTGVREELK